MKHQRNILEVRASLNLEVNRMTKGRRLCRMLLSASLCVTMAGNTGMTAMASSTDYLDSLSTGVSNVLDGNLTATADTKSVSENDSIAFGGLENWGKSEEKSEGRFDVLKPTAGDSGFQTIGNKFFSEQNAGKNQAERAAEAKTEAAVETEIKAEEKKKAADGGENGTIVMANVKNSVNVRAESDENSEKVGYLYADCGGTILERKDGWTKMKSGDLVGWVKDEFLLFGEEAEKMANDVGNLIVTIQADALRVREEPHENASVLGMIARDDELDVIEELDGWVSVEYDKKTGYVSEEFVDAQFRIDYGETIEAVKAREQKEAAEKAKLTQNRGAVAVEAADDLLLAALIQCEAGNQPYEGQLAVGAVVMNRVRSGGYPGSVNGVIYASGQFTPALNGKVARVVQGGNVKASCLQAAREAIAGASNIGGATHFRRAGSRDGIVIGNHVFW